MAQQTTATVPRMILWINAAAEWLDYHWPKPNLDWRWRMVDFFCLCDCCREAAAKGHPRNRWFEDGWTGM